MRLQTKHVHDPEYIMLACLRACVVRTFTEENPLFQIVEIKNMLDDVVRDTVYEED